MTKRMSIGQFAKLTGVSQRTLRFYEEKGMLQPSYISESGRRYYEEKDMIPLQQIIAFKYLGFSLEEIHEMMRQQTGSLVDSLLLQKQAMEKKRAHMNQMIKAIDHAVEVLATDESIDPQVFSYLIHSVITEPEQMEWLSQHFPEQMVSNLKQHLDGDDKTMDWNKRSTFLVQKLKRAIVLHPPESDEVQSIFDKLIGLLQEMFGDDWWTISLSLEHLEDTSIPDIFASPFTEEEERLVVAASEYYMKTKGLLPDESDED